jgi:hypothetical protein
MPATIKKNKRKKSPKNKYSCNDLPKKGKQYEQFLKQQQLLEKEKYERDLEIENIKNQQQLNEEQNMINQMSLVNH